MTSIVILASGRGSNFDAIQAAVQEKRLNAEILAVVSDRSDALVLAKAEKAGIRSILIPFPKTDFGSLSERRAEHEGRLLKELSRLKPDFLVLAGYMRILTPAFIEAFRCKKGYVRIVNIHPSILPAFSGKDSYTQAFDYGVKVAGVTVHLVEKEVDNGPICAQEVFSIEDCKTASEVMNRGLAIEHQLYPRVLNWILAENFELENRSDGRFYVRQN